MRIKPLRETPLRRFRLGVGVPDLAVRCIERVEALFTPVREGLDIRAVQTDLVRIDRPVFVVVFFGMPVIAGPMPGFDRSAAARMRFRDIFQRFGCDGDEALFFGLFRLARGDARARRFGGRIRCEHEHIAVSE